MKGVPGFNSVRSGYYLSQDKGLNSLGPPRVYGQKRN